MSAGNIVGTLVYLDRRDRIIGIETMDGGVSRFTLPLADIDRAAPHFGMPITLAPNRIVRAASLVTE